MAKILVVDDELEICEILKDFLTDLGHEVKTVTRGEKALENIQEDRPDLMILDIRMPEMDGIQVLKATKSITSDLGVIIVSAANDEVIVKEAIREGAYDYITKPIDLVYLESSLATRLQGPEG